MAESGAVTLEQLQSYDTIIYGGGLYAIGINGIRLIRDNFTALKQKHLIVWAKDEMGLLKAYEVPEYHCNKKNIAPMIQYIRDLEKEDIHERDHI